MTMNTNQSEQTKEEQELNRLISVLYQRAIHFLKLEFPDYTITGTVKGHHLFGPFFTFQLKNEPANLEYNCGFAFKELMEKLQEEQIARQWLASFFVDMLDEHTSRPLPPNPDNTEEAIKVTKEQVIPHIIQSIREEFGDTRVKVQFGEHEKLGTIIEASFPEITDGQNATAFALQLLLTLHLLNRDCAEPIITNLYTLLERANLE